MNKQSLIYIPEIKSKARLRLICFPYAGGSSATYIPWITKLKSNIELVTIQLPGRGSRLIETPYQTMNEMTYEIFNAIKILEPKQTIFYGHSMGARVAYELMLLLWKHKCQLPVHMIASGSPAPHIKFRKEKIHHLPDNEFIRKIGELNGTHIDVLNNHEFMQLLLPALRADFGIIENYTNKNRIILPIGISVFAGDKDDLILNDIEEWFKLFKSNTGIHWISGGHFFVDKNQTDVLQVLHDVISKIQ